MTTINTFGITVADISGQVHNLRIDASSSPTEAQVDEMIQQNAALLAMELQAAGITAAGLVDVTDATYVLCKRGIINKTVSDVLVARNRGEAAAGAYYMANWDKLIETVRQYPQRVESQDTQGPDLAAFIAQGAGDLQDIPFYSSISGKIVIGGL